MDSINLGSSDNSARKSNSRPSPSAAGEAASGFGPTVILGAPDRSLELQGATIRRLVADRTVLRARGASTSRRRRAHTRAHVRKAAGAESNRCPQPGRGLSSRCFGQLGAAEGVAPGRNAAPARCWWLPSHAAFSPIRACVRGRPVDARASQGADRSGVRAGRANQRRVGFKSVPDQDGCSIRQLHESARATIRTFAFAGPGSAPRSANARFAAFAKQGRRATPDPGGVACIELIHRCPHRGGWPVGAASIRCGVPAQR